LVEIIVFPEHIIDSRKPNACALLFERHRYVPKHVHTVSLQCGGDEVWISYDIVVALATMGDVVGLQGRQER